MATAVPDDQRPMLSAADLAAKLNVPLSTVYHWRAQGLGPVGIRIGKHVRFRPADVEAWLEEHTDDRGVQATA